MAHAYTPGLKVAARVHHRLRRALPLPGDVLVEVGQRVAARDVVACALLPGPVTPLNLANQLALPPADVPSCVLKRVGDPIAEGEVLARTKGIFGLFKSEYRARTSGIIESISEVTGQVLIRGEPQPVQVLAHLPGEVTEVLPAEGAVIEAEVTLVQGIFGIGGETYGSLHVLPHDADLVPELLTDEMRGAVVAAGGRVTHAALVKAVELGLSALVAGGVDDQDLKQFLGYDLGVAITGSEQVGLTLIVTEGFGNIRMAERTWQLLRSRAGCEASVNGATQIRAGVMRPEILVPLDAATGSQGPEAAAAGQLEVGRMVRIIRAPYFGVIGQVSALPPQPQVLPSGSRARVLEVSLGDGRTLTVPRANVELIEE
jgi:hypothetical protein